MKKSISVFVLVFFFLVVHPAFASLSINEINYDLSGSDSTSSKAREWVEIYNPGPTDVSIDATKWRFYDGGGNRTINGEVDFSIPANSYVIFAGDKDTFLADHSGFGGLVYDTGFTSLNNTGATLKILDQDGNSVDEVSYTSSQGGAGDGNTLQKISGSWGGAIPTPGIANEAVSTPPPASSSGGGGSSNLSTANTSTTETKIKVVEIPKIKTQIFTQNLGYVNLPIVFDVMTLGYSGEQLHYGKYYWNFGDGDSKEIQLNNSSKFAHTYFYPGDYVVSLSYYSNYYSDNIDASAQSTIKIVEADVVISRVGDEKDFFIELSNNTDYSADLSNWSLSSDNKSFTIPRNTILASKKKMIISPKITGFIITDKDSLKLINSNMEVVFDHAVPLVRQDLIVTAKTDVGRPTVISTVEDIASPIVPLENLGANVLQSDALENNSDNTYWPIIFTVILAGVGAGGVYFIRQKRVIPGEGEDFEILDE
ncbi:MAG: lamin tail domain-containing protein [Candidatus Paceibacterota bacterium]|jgi:hypothetical protein